MTRPTTRKVLNLLRKLRRSTVPTAAPKFVGATEHFGVELEELRQMEPDPNLVSEVEADLNWALAWHEFERHMLDEIDRVFAPILVAAAELQDFDEVRELVFA